tara:strand:+ start:709 stop:1404 length:696 start_codon:yes stop_codon:yes gene_type:complete
VPSTALAEKLGFRAIGTSSFAIASILGYNDGEEMEFSELEYFVERISSVSKLPLSVDLESGYSRRPKKIAENIIRLGNLGVVGINFEDSKVENKRTLLNENEFAKTISEVKELLEKANVDMFLNVRTDTFLLGHSNVIVETKKRIKLYESAGADGIFTPCIEKKTDIEEIVNSTTLPINVMCMPNLPNFDTLEKLGVKRISMGNFLFDKMYSSLEKITQNVLTDKSFNSIF